MDVLFTTSNNLINEIYEKALRLTSELNDILINGLPLLKTKYLHKIKTSQTLSIEVYNNVNILSPPIMLDLFTTWNNIYHHRNL